MLRIAPFGAFCFLRVDSRYKAIPDEIKKGMLCGIPFLFVPMKPYFLFLPMLLNTFSSILMNFFSTSK